jgi:hypothetical protein
MKNYKKLLLAGLAIVPLALSSWASGDPPDTNYQKIGNYDTKTSVGTIGQADVSGEILITDKQRVTERQSLLRTGENLIKTLEPVPTIQEIVKKYQ